MRPLTTAPERESEAADEVRHGEGGGEARLRPGHGGRVHAQAAAEVAHHRPTGAHLLLLAHSGKLTSR